ncbi:MFS transporter [Bailinhaonella thermotolerans]|uniref:MFS transporter n=1 Tax=Bailinhaonella thermotolerans TaxID=1070861 RepID=A0A3A4AAZ3_9ACTN|nr:MFS transporter [Bailinhaonella thermotolerans]RJL23220.1 MFS transporter [Bailinhaonella thermotolerans]
MTTDSQAGAGRVRVLLAAHAGRAGAPLRTPAFARYVAAGLLSSAGTAMATGAVAYAVLEAGGGAAGVAVVYLGQMLATLVMLPLGGVWADRLPRVRLIVVVELCIGLLVAGQAGLVAAGHARPGQLALIAAAVSIASALGDPARFGLVAGIVAPEHLPQANALLKTGHYGVLMAGPALGGWLVAAAGPAWGIGANAASFILSALLLSGVTAPARTPAVRRFAADLAQGWRLVTGAPWIWASVAGSGVMVACWHLAYGIVGLTYVQTHLGGPAAWGVVAASLGIGMVAGSLVSLVWTPRRAGYAHCFAIVPMALPGLSMAAGAPLAVIAAAVVAAAAGLAIAAVTWRSLVQQRVPADQQGRVSAWVTLGELVLAPPAYLLVGPAVAALGLRGTLLVCGVGILAAAIAPLAHRDVRALTLLPPAPYGGEEDPG